MTRKQIIKHILREESTPEVINNIKSNRLVYGLKSDEKFLIYLKKELNISSFEYKNILYKIESTEPMPNTQLLNFIINQLEEKGVKWNGQKELFKMLIPNENWKEYKKSWYQWREEYTQQIKKDAIRQSIQKRLNFSSYLWNYPEIKQRKIIPLKVEAFLKNESKIEKQIDNSLDLLIIKPIDPPITLEQKQFLELLNSEVIMNIEILLKKHRKFFIKKKENQKFLLEAVSTLYNKGFYQFLKEKLFPSLSRHNKERIEIKIKEAYTLIYCECSSYEEIFYLLKSIPKKSEEQNININTMIIHAFIKHQVYNYDLNKQELFNVLQMSIGYYQLLYQENNSPLRYYPAIQLAYIVKILNILAPSYQNRANLNMDINKIYNAVKLDIQNNKEMGGYFQYSATMSQFEFLLLLNQPYDSFEIEMFIESFQPEVSLVTQTINQIQCFIDIIQRFDNENDMVQTFSKILEIFKSYILWK